MLLVKIAFPLACLCLLGTILTGIASLTGKAGIIGSTLIIVLSLLAGSIAFSEMTAFLIIRKGNRNRVDGRELGMLNELVIMRGISWKSYGAFLFSALTPAMGIFLIPEDISVINELSSMPILERAIIPQVVALFIVIVGVISIQICRLLQSQ